MTCASMVVQHYAKAFSRISNAFCYPSVLSAHGSAHTLGSKSSASISFSNDLTHALFSLTPFSLKSIYSVFQKKQYSHYNVALLLHSLPISKKEEMSLGRRSALVVLPMLQFLLVA